MKTLWLFLCCLLLLTGIFGFASNQANAMTTYSTTSNAYVINGFWTARGANGAVSHTYDTDLIPGSKSTYIKKLQSNTAANAAVDKNITSTYGTINKSVDTGAEAVFSFALNDKSPSGPSIDGHGLSASNANAGLRLNRIDPNTVKGLNNIALLSAPDPSLINTDRLHKLDESENQISFRLTSLSPVTSPEPAAILLFGVVLVGLAGLGRKKLLKKS